MMYLPLTFALGCAVAAACAMHDGDYITGLLIAACAGLSAVVGFVLALDATAQDEDGA
jgi:hypothetical protein